MFRGSKRKPPGPKPACACDTCPLCKGRVRRRRYYYKSKKRHAIRIAALRASGQFEELPPDTRVEVAHV